MRRAIVTGAAGLVGSETVLTLLRSGWQVAGVDNNQRAAFFGAAASTARTRDELLGRPGYTHYDCDVSRGGDVEMLFSECEGGVNLVVHAAAQPSHDWSAANPRRDFEVNAVGTLNLLEAVRASCPEAVFVLLSTNKVYGDRPNALPLVEQETRWDIPPDHQYHQGIDEFMALDQCLHSPFGVSKASADLMTQEYGRYFGLKTVVIRCGCITGARHAGARLHGFLSYLVRTAVAGESYTIIGYKGKQVRDNVDARDVAWAIELVAEQARPGGVYNLGGGRDSNCSILEAIAFVEQVLGRPLATAYEENPRAGDHQWWVSDTGRFRSDYPAWHIRHDWRDSICEIARAVRQSPVVR